MAVKLFGDDFPTLTAKAKEVEAALRDIPGVADLAVEQITGQPMLQVRIKQDEIARYGVPAQAVLDLVESVGSKPLSEVVEGQVRFPLVVRVPVLTPIACCTSPPTRAMTGSSSRRITAPGPQSLSAAS